MSCVLSMVLVNREITECLQVSWKLRAGGFVGAYKEPAVQG